MVRADSIIPLLQRAVAKKLAAWWSCDGLNVRHLLLLFLCLLLPFLYLLLPSTVFVIPTTVFTTAGLTPPVPFPFSSLVWYLMP